MHLIIGLSYHAWVDGRHVSVYFLTVFVHHAVVPLVTCEDTSWSTGVQLAGEVLKVCACNIVPVYLGIVEGHSPLGRLRLRAHNITM